MSCKAAQITRFGSRQPQSLRDFIAEFAHLRWRGLVSKMRVKAVANSTGRSDGELLADDVPSAGEQDVDIAVDAAEKAFPAWKKMSAIQRRGIMNKFADLVEKHANDIAELTRISLGQPSAFGSFEIGLCAEVCTHVPVYLSDY